MTLDTFFYLQQQRIAERLLAWHYHMRRRQLRLEYEAHFWPAHYHAEMRAIAFLRDT